MCRYLTDKVVRLHVLSDEIRKKPVYWLSTRLKMHLHMKMLQLHSRNCELHLALLRKLYLYRGQRCHTPVRSVYVPRHATEKFSQWPIDRVCNLVASGCNTCLIRLAHDNLSSPCSPGYTWLSILLVPNRLEFRVRASRPSW